LNPVLAVLLLNQAVTGVLHDVMSKDAYEFFHEGGGILLVIGVLLHVLLNWSWVKANFKRKAPKVN
jgi:hypothetical protein